ncbi:DNA helicase, ATP-dependent [Trema orientale]|uniref:RNA helicase n=1 Tax=Trema orientale TaxID=63057 RepID=A0A2P5EBE2_TREOI|nr:DNA helicase, ATP-dependent [Trema orientale]
MTGIKSPWRTGGGGKGGDRPRQEPSLSSSSSPKSLIHTILVTPISPGGIVGGVFQCTVSSTISMEKRGNTQPIDVDKTTATLEAEKTTGGGLYLPGKDRVVFRPPERKSLLGLDILANAKRGESKVDGGFKAPGERVVSLAASMEEEENYGSSVTDDTGDKTSTGMRNPARRQYREIAASETPYRESTLTQEDKVDDRYGTHRLGGPKPSDVSTISAQSSQSIRSRSPRYDRDDHVRERRDYRGDKDDRGSGRGEYRDHYDRDDRRGGRRDYKDDARADNRRVRQGHSNGSKDQYYGRESCDRDEPGYGGDYGRKRSRYDSSKRGSGRSNWDDGKWEWEDTPRQDSYSNSSRRHQPSPSPMFVGASPDARLVSPWLGGNTPHYTGSNVSSWDNVSPSPAPIRASGSSVRSSNSRNSGRSHQLSFSSENSRSYEDGEGEGADLAEEQKYEISESMRLEMEYNSDRAWYDREEGNTMFDTDSSSFFFGDEASFQKKEAELAKRLVRRDGTKMTLAQTKKLSQRTVDNAQWEDRQLLRSGAVRGTEVQTEFDDEEERKVILLVHDTKPPFLDGRVVFTKQAEPIMPIKDPTSDMAIISRKGSTLVKEIHEKQSQNKSRQRFWELAGSKLGDILGVEKSAEQIDADTAAVGEDGEIDFKEEAKFAQHLKKGEAVSDFAKTKTIAQQRQYLPIFSVRDELLQVIRENQVVVVVGETGSGKTTQLTQYLHEDGYTVNGIVGCTQPRRVAAMSVAKRVSEEMDTELGDKVGYAIRFEDVTGPNTIIKYMTDGVLLRETLKDADLEKYRIVVMDEAHERSLSTDVLFGILKKVVAQRRDFKLIVTSATLNAQKFSNFFGSVPIFHIPGRTFPVNILYSKSPCEDYVEAAVKQAMTIHITSPPGDILIFMTGQDEIEAACYALAEPVEPQWMAELGPMFFSVKDSDTSLLEHKKRQKEEKTAMEEEMENLRKDQAEAERENKEKERERRAKQQQRVSTPGLPKGSSTYLRPKRLGL